METLAIHFLIIVTTAIFQLGRSLERAMKESKAIDTFRRQFFKQRLDKVRDQGILVFDEACLSLHNEETKTDVLVSVTFST